MIIVKNTQIFIDEFVSKLSTLNPDKQEVYHQNANAYVHESHLATHNHATIDAGSQNTLLFGDRFPFRYLVDDYGLDYFTAFNGCSAETEASFETITFLSQKIDELGLKKDCEHPSNKI